MGSSAVADLMEGDALVQLLRYALPRSAVAGMEGCVVAERAAACSDGSVPVGTGEAGIDDELLQPLAVFLPEIPRV